MHSTHPPVTATLLPVQLTAMRIVGNSVVLLSCVLLLVGAFFFGIASCGGYLRHKEFFRVASAMMWLLVVLVPSTLLFTWKRKLGLVPRC